MSKSDPPAPTSVSASAALPDPSHPNEPPFGGWHFDERTLVLRYNDYYEIDLEKILNAGSALQWVIHLCQKSPGWLPDSEFRNLIRALHWAVDLYSLSKDNRPVPRWDRDVSTEPDPD